MINSGVILHSRGGETKRRKRQENAHGVPRSDVAARAHATAHLNTASHEERSGLRQAAVMALTAGHSRLFRYL